MIIFFMAKKYILALVVACVANGLPWPVKIVAHFPVLINKYVVSFSSYKNARNKLILWFWYYAVGVQTENEI